jgi:hypothetical protein
MDSERCFYSEFSILIQLYREKLVQCLRTRNWIWEYKFLKNLSPVRLFVAIVTFYFNCFDTAVLAHQFLALASFPVPFSVLSCWTNRALSTPFTSFGFTITCHRYVTGIQIPQAAFSLSHTVSLYKNPQTGKYNLLIIQAGLKWEEAVKSGVRTPAMGANITLLQNMN